MRQFLITLFVFILLAHIRLSAQNNQKSEPTYKLTESQKIEYLIASIENLINGKFWRNGNWYDAKTAASHLRMKVEKAGKRVKTAEDFIKYVGSCSSVSGKPYKIRFSDGTEMETKIYFTELLAKLNEN